jgi:hypothetical protein
MPKPLKALKKLSKNLVYSAGSVVSFTILPWGEANASIIATLPMIFPKPLHPVAGCRIQEVFHRHSLLAAEYYRL